MWKFPVICPWVTTYIYNVEDLHNEGCTTSADLCFCVARNKQLNQLIGLWRRFAAVRAHQLMDGMMLGRLSHSALTYCNRFSSRLLTSPLCNLSDPLAARLRLTCRYAMATCGVAATEWNGGVVCAEEMWICVLGTPFGLKLEQVDQLTEVVWRSPWIAVPWPSRPTPIAGASVQPFVGNRNVHINVVWGV